MIAMSLTLAARALGGAWDLAVDVPQRAGVRRDVDRVLLERGERDDLQGALVRGREQPRGGQAVVVGTEPVRRRDAPAAAGYEARKPELRVVG